MDGEAFACIDVEESSTVPERRQHTDYDGVISVDSEMNEPQLAEINQMSEDGGGGDNSLNEPVSVSGDNAEDDDKNDTWTQNDHLSTTDHTRIGQGIPKELRLLCYRKLNFDGNEDINNNNNNNDDSSSDTSDRMPSLVRYFRGSFRSLSSIASNRSTGTSCCIDFADDCSSIPSINTIKTFATTESEVATVKTRNFIPGIVVPQKERRWDEFGGDSCRKTTGIDKNDTVPMLSPLAATSPKHKTTTTRRGHPDSIPIPTLRSND
jgi:hypothetical protein